MIRVIIGCDHCGREWEDDSFGIECHVHREQRCHLCSGCKDEYARLLASWERDKRTALDLFFHTTDFTLKPDSRVIRPMPSYENGPKGLV